MHFIDDDDDDDDMYTDVEFDSIYSFRVCLLGHDSMLVTDIRPGRMILTANLYDDEVGKL